MQRSLASKLYWVDSEEIEIILVRTPINRYGILTWNQRAPCDAEPRNIEKQVIAWKS